MFSILLKMIYRTKNLFMAQNTESIRLYNLYMINFSML